jgi:hypothetical protein
MRLALPLLLLAAALAAGCGLRDAGPPTVQSRDLPEFTRVAVQDGIDVHVRTGPAAPAVRVRAGSKVIDDVKTRVEDGTLRLWQEGSGWSGDIDVDVAMASLAGLSAADGADLDVAGLSAPALDVLAEDGADVDVAGRVGQLRLRAEDGADADLGELRAEAVRAELSDGADASVFATGSLTARVTDGADLDERGRAAQRDVITPD